MLDYGILSELNELSTAVRVLLAVILGGAVGFERGKHGRAAGLRTHVLVCVGSALCSLTGMYLVSSFHMGDPTRIASGVVSGIGFLGAGMILITNNTKVTGLTTAAALWATATVGLAVGAGYYVGAILTALVIYATTTLLTVFEIRQKKDISFYIEIDDYHYANEVVNTIKGSFNYAHNFDIVPSKTNVDGHVGITMNINIEDETKSNILQELLTMEHVIIAINS